MHYLDHALMEYASEGWQLVQGSGMQYVNYQWRIGLQFERPIKDKREIRYGE